jgi:hypothetical protein
MFGPALTVGLRTGALKISSERAEPAETLDGDIGKKKKKKKKKAKYFLDAEGLNEIRPPRLRSVSIAFSLQPTEGGAGLTYERLIRDQGVVLTRNNSWHDILNALTWFYLPTAKRALNRLQCAAADVWEAVRPRQQQTQTGRGRSPLQSRLAHFDECGGIALLPLDMADQLRGHEWIDLFLDNRQRWLNGEARVIIFGHGLLEQGLVRVPTMVAHSLVFVVEEEESDQDGGSAAHRGLAVPPTVVDLNEGELVEFVDGRLAKYFDDLTNKVLLHDSSSDHKVTAETFATVPVPIMGVPGWSEGNDREDFYKNSKQFR